MLVEKRKYSAMRIYKRRAVAAVLLPVLATLTATVSAWAGTTPFVSAREALKQGMSAFQGGYYEIAIPALEFAAPEEAMANYYLARIYADSTGAHTDHAKSYMLMQKVVDELAEVDPDNDPRASYVGTSLTALARYIRAGIPDIGLAPDLNRAVEYLHNASVIFDNEDAQFELAKLQLNGEEATFRIGRAGFDFGAVLGDEGFDGRRHIGCRTLGAFD